LSPGRASLFSMVRDRGIFIDVKSVLEPSRAEGRVCYWSL